MDDSTACMAQLPSAEQAQLIDRVTAATLALGMAKRCLDTPGPMTHTGPQLRRYVVLAIEQLHAVLTDLPGPEPGPAAAPDSAIARHDGQ